MVARRNDPPSRAGLRELFAYDPATGIFTRRIRSGKCAAGATFGTMNGMGYLIGGIDYRLYLLHRLAWLYVHNEWPEQIDHINLDKADNRIANLRPANQQLNEANKPLSVANTSGFKGVSWDGKNSRFRAGIKVNGKSLNLGRFDSAEEAHRAYRAAASKHFGEFARAQ